MSRYGKRYLKKHTPVHTEDYFDPASMYDVLHRGVDGLIRGLVKRSLTEGRRVSFKIVGIATKTKHLDNNNHITYHYSIARTFRILIDSQFFLVKIDCGIWSKWRDPCAYVRDLANRGVLLVIIYVFINQC